MKNITKKDGTVFGNRGSAAAALKIKGLTDTYEVIVKGKGFIGVPKAKGTAPKKQKLIKCRVYRSNVDPDNRDTPISVTHNSISNRKTFWPGQEVDLTQGHINILKDSVEESRINIPPESGIYASKDPVAVAKNFYPNMQAEVNQADNSITMVSRIPNYIVELAE